MQRLKAWLRWYFLPYRAAMMLRDVALEEAAVLVEDIIKLHRNNTGHSPEHWCEDFGCVDLLVIAQVIRRKKCGSGVKIPKE